MGKLEREIAEFRSESAKNKTYKDLVRLCGLLGLKVVHGKGSSFKVRTKNGKNILQLHRKKNNKALLDYEIKAIRDMLDELEV